MTEGPNGPVEDGSVFMNRLYLNSRMNNPDNMQRYRVDEWHDYRPSLLRRLVDRLRRTAN